MKYKIDFLTDMVGKTRLEDIRYSKICPICKKEKSRDNFTQTTLISKGFCCYDCYPG